MAVILLRTITTAVSLEICNPNLSWAKIGIDELSKTDKSSWRTISRRMIRKVMTQVSTFRMVAKRSRLKVNTKRLPNRRRKTMLNTNALQRTRAKNSRWGNQLTTRLQATISTTFWSTVGSSIRERLRRRKSRPLRLRILKPWMPSMMSSLASRTNNRGLIVHGP